MRRFNGRARRPFLSPVPLWRYAFLDIGRSIVNRILGLDSLHIEHVLRHSRDRKVCTSVMASEILFAGSLGALVAVSFVVLETLLLPLFEYTRKSLTIAVVRDRIAQGKLVKICPERPAANALGLSDGLSGDSGFIIVPRALKVFFKVSLIVSVFTWEFQLDTIDRAQLLSFHFNDNGPSGPRNESLVMFPIPIIGIPERPPSPNLTQGGTSFRKNYTRSRVRGVDLDFAARCASEEKGIRFVYLAIYAQDDVGRRKIHCLNGTDSREKVPILSYNQSLTVVRSNISSLVLEKRLAKENNNTLLFSGKLTVPSEAPLNGTHHGFIRIIRGEYRSRENSDAWGLFIHSRTGTVMKLIHRAGYSAGMTCRSKGIPASRRDYKCVFDNDHVQNASFEFAGERLPEVQDMDLRFEENAMFRVGKPRDVIRAWIVENSLTHIYSNFASEFWYVLQRDTFFSRCLAKISLLLGLAHRRNT